MMKRIDYVDAVAGIMILRMIFVHCTHFSGFSLSFIRPFMIFSSFYMPWFFYKSGAFFQPRNQKDLFGKDFWKFVSPFVMYSIFGWIIWSFFGIIDDGQSLRSCVVIPIKQFIHHGSIEANGPLWFLLSLFFVRELVNFGLNKSLPPLVLSGASFIVAYILYVIGWHHYSWWLGNIFSGLSFFCLGYWLKDKESRLVLVVICAIVCFTILIADVFDLVKYPSLYMHANKMGRGNYILFYPLALAGIVITNQLFRFLESKMRFPVLEFIGRNSMNFYVTHWILFTIVVFVTKYIFHVESPKCLFYILLMSSIVFLPLISKLINAVKAKNKFFNKIL